METRSRMSRSLHTNRDFEKLEPYEGKPSRTVLRGEEGSNALDLPDNIKENNGLWKIIVIFSNMTGKMKFCVQLCSIIII